MFFANSRVTNGIRANLRNFVTKEVDLQPETPAGDLQASEKRAAESFFHFFISDERQFHFQLHEKHGIRGETVQPVSANCLARKGRRVRTAKVCVAIKPHENAQSLLLLIAQFRWKTTRNGAARFMANMNQLTKRAIEVECKWPTTKKNGKFNDACRARLARQENARFSLVALQWLMQERKSNSNVVGYSTLAGKMIFFCFNLRPVGGITFLR